MADASGLRTRSTALADAAAIAAIYNQGIADRIATFETAPRSAGQIAEWFSGRRLVIVAETETAGLVAFAASFPYSDRPCYSGIGEFSVYVRRDYRGRGVGRTVPCRADGSGDGRWLAQAHEPGISGEPCEPRPFERARVRGNRNPSPSWKIGWHLA